VDVVDAEDPRERYSNAVRIGSGASSTIFLADDKRAGHKVALKVTPITDKSKGAIAHEVTVMRENKHANIIELYGCYYMAAASPPEVWIAIEYMDGGALQNVVDIFDQFRLTDQQIAHILWKVRGSVRTSARLRARSSRPHRQRADAAGVGVHALHQQPDPSRPQVRQRALQSSGPDQTW